MKRIVAKQKGGKDFGLRGGFFSALECAAKPFGGEVVARAKRVFEIDIRATSDALERGFGELPRGFFDTLAALAALGEAEALLLTNPRLDEGIGMVLECEVDGLFGVKRETVGLIDQREHRTQGAQGELSDLVSELIGREASGDLFEELDGKGVLIELSESIEQRASVLWSKGLGQDSGEMLELSCFSRWGETQKIKGLGQVREQKVECRGLLGHLFAKEGEGFVGEMEQGVSHELGGGVCFLEDEVEQGVVAEPIHGTMRLKTEHSHSAFRVSEDGDKEVLRREMRKQVLKGIGFIEAHQPSDDDQIELSVGSKAERSVDPFCERIKEADGRAGIKYLAGHLLAQREGKVACPKEPRDRAQEQASSVFGPLGRTRANAQDGGGKA